VGHTLYELLCANTVQVQVRDTTPGSRLKPVTLRAEHLRPAGFSENESMMPVPRRSFPGYRLLQEYFVFPDQFLFFEVTGLTESFSSDKVYNINTQSSRTIRYDPFYSFRHASLREKRQTFWLASRRPSGRLGDEGTEMSISLVDLSARPVRPDVDTIHMRLTCTNRDLPARLPFGNEAGDFELEGGAAIKRIVALRKPTNPVRPPLGKAALWRLISHL